MEDSKILFGYLSNPNIFASPGREHDHIHGVEIPMMSLARSEMMVASESGFPSWGFVHCENDQSFGDDLADNLRHFEDLCVPVVHLGMCIAQCHHADAIAEYRKSSEERGIFFTGGSESVGMLSESEQKWFWTPNPSAILEEVMSFPMLVSRLTVLLGRGMVRVATVAVDGLILDSVDYGEIPILLERRLRLNGVDIRTNEALGLYRRFLITDGAAPTSEIASFEPSIVIFLTDNLFDRAVGPGPSTGDTIRAVEAAWRVGSSRPFYLLSKRPQSVLEAVSDSPDLATRIYTAVMKSEAPDSVLLAAFQRKVQNSNYPVSVYAREYDAAYALGAAAISVKGNTRLNGSAVFQQLLGLNPPGTPFDVGPGDYQELVSTLVDGGDVDLNGVSGPLNYPPDVDYWCVRTGTPPAFQLSGLLYRGVTGEGIGELTSCR